MSNYIITKDIDLSEEFDELSIKDQKDLIVSKFSRFNPDNQEDMLEDMFGATSDYSIVKILQKAFDGLSSKYQAEIIDYIEDSNIA